MYHRIFISHMMTKSSVKFYVCIDLCYFYSREININEEVRYDYGVKDLPWSKIRAPRLKVTTLCKNVEFKVYLLLQLSSRFTYFFNLARNSVDVFGLDFKTKYLTKLVCKS